MLCFIKKPEKNTGVLNHEKINYTTKLRLRLLLLTLLMSHYPLNQRRQRFAAGTESDVNSSEGLFPVEEISLRLSPPSPK